jgi:glycosyltransferase involved in cell wall biosynthesis
MDNTTELSIIIPISERYDDAKSVYASYKDAIASIGQPHEFIYVLDGDYPGFFKDLHDLIDSGEKIKIIKLARSFGEATALTAGFEHASGDVIITLPAYLQIVPSEIPRLLDQLENSDMIVARRWPRDDSLINRIQSKAFHMPVRFLTGLDFQDLGCGVRIIKRKVIEELNIYGDQHRFLPLLAYKQGFKVSQIDASQAPQDTNKRLYSFGIYLRRLLDILSIFFLIKFTKKPMRFFGLLGSGIFGIGILVLVVLAAQRLIWSIPLADRPMLLLGSLLIVLGIQIFAIGLIGEIIIFTHAKEIKEYTVEEIIN